MTQQNHLPAVRNACVEVETPSPTITQQYPVSPMYFGINKHLAHSSNKWVPTRSQWSCVTFNETVWKFSIYTSLDPLFCGKSKFIHIRGRTVWASSLSHIYSHSDTNVWKFVRLMCPASHKSISNSNFTCLGGGNLSWWAWFSVCLWWAWWSTWSSWTTRWMSHTSTMLHPRTATITTPTCSWKNSCSQASPSWTFSPSSSVYLYR